MQDPHGRHFWCDAQYDADIATCRSGDARLLSGWASSRIAYRTAGLPRQDCVQFIFLWILARFSSGATCGIWQAFPLATNTRVSASCSCWLRDLGVCASASWRFALLLGSMVLPCSFWTIASIALETRMCGRCDRGLHHDVEIRCGVESGSCVVLTFAMSSTVSIVVLMRCRICKCMKTRSFFPVTGPEALMLCCARSRHCCRGKNARKRQGVSVQERSRSRLVQWQEKDNCHRGANFLRQLKSWRSMWRSLNSNIRSLCRNHMKVHELISIHHCAHVKDDEEEERTRGSRATIAQ